MIFTTIFYEKKLLYAQVLFWIFYCAMSYWGNVKLPEEPQFSWVHVLGATLFILLAFYAFAWLIWLLPGKFWRHVLLMLVLLVVILGCLSNRLIYHWLPKLEIWYFNPEVFQDFNQFLYKYVQKTYHFMANAALLVNIYKIKLKTKENEEEQKKNHQLHIRMLSAAINPHFIFNTLNHVYTDMLKNITRSAIHIKLLADLYRYNVLHANQGTALVPLSDELAQADRFIELQKYRYPSDFAVHVLLDGNPDGWEIPPVTIMTALENSFNYGYFRQAEHPVQLNIDCSPGRLRISCRNKIMQQRKDRASTGMGTENLKHRLALQFGRKANVRIENDGWYYEIVITIEK